jgi:hypothetical protein
MTISTLPTPSPNRSQTQEVFSPAMDATLGALPTLVSEINTTVGDINTAASTVATQTGIATSQANAAAASAATASSFASAASLAANAVLWVSGATVAQYAVVISPANYQNYRRKTATGSGTTDPSLDSTNYERISAVSLGIGSSSVTGSTTLTNASNGVQVLDSTTFGDFVQLPDARTMLSGEGVFTFRNISGYDRFIKDASGSFLAVLKAGETCTVSLGDNTTLAGTWLFVGVVSIGVDVQAMVTGMSASPWSVNSQVSYLNTVSLDSTRTLFLVSGDTCLQSFVYDSSTKTFGSPQLVRTANIGSLVKAVLVTTNKVLVVTGETSVAAINANVLTITGTSVSVGATNTTSLANAIGQLSTPILVGSSVVVGYTRPTSNVNALRAYTISGTTNSTGSETVLTGSETSLPPSLLYFTTSVMAVISFISAGSAPALQVFTASSTTLTLGGNASLPLTGSPGAYLVRPLSTGRYAFVSYNSSTVYGSIISLSGTTPTSSTVTLMSGGALPAVTTVSNQLVAVSSTTYTTTLNVLTDNTGTGVAGTSVSVMHEASAISVGAIGYINSKILFDVVIGGAANYGKILNITLSGNNISNVYQLPYNIAAGTSSTYTNDKPITEEYGRGYLKSATKAVGCFGLRSSSDTFVKLAHGEIMKPVNSPGVAFNGNTNFTAYGPSASEGWIVNCVGTSTTAFVQKVRLVG